LRRHRALAVAVPVTLPAKAKRNKRRFESMYSAFGGLTGLRSPPVKLGHGHEVDPMAKRTDILKIAAFAVAIAILFYYLAHYGV
jgi:hypothetical protein